MRMARCSDFGLLVLALVLIATTSAFRPRFESQGSPEALATANATPCATSSPRPATELSPKSSEPDLHAAVERLERDLAKGGEPYWPVTFSLVKREGRRYACVRTTFYGSGRRMWLLEESHPEGSWRPLGHASRMGEGNTGPMTAREKSELGSDQLPSDVWNALGETPEHSFDEHLATPQSDAREIRT